MSRLETILLYQETDQKRQDLEQAVRSTPARQRFSQLHKLLKTQQATIQQLTDEMTSKVAKATKLAEQAAALESRLELESGELETIAGDEESTAEEMTELRRDVEKLQRDINNVVREAKQLMAEVESKKKDYINTNQTAREAKKEYDQLRMVCEKERDESSAEIAKVEEELKRIGKDLPEAFLAKFEKVRQHHPDAVVPVIGGKCSGCNMSLATVALKKLSGEDTFIECENCGRILYGEQQNN